MNRQSSDFHDVSTPCLNSSARPCFQVKQVTNRSIPPRSFLPAAILPCVSARGRVQAGDCICQGLVRGRWPRASACAPVHRRVHAWLHRCTRGCAGGRLILFYFSCDEGCFVLVHVTPPHLLMRTPSVTLLCLPSLSPCPARLAIMDYLYYNSSSSTTPMFT